MFDDRYTSMKENDHETGLEVAIIGMAGRFPGARNLEEFWDNLKKGIESVTFFNDKELAEEGVRPQFLKDPHYVKAMGILEDYEYFDASFFGYTPSEGLVIDPQVRLFHECAWHALEDAGYVPGTYDGLIGVYSGAKGDLFWSLKTMLAPSQENVNPMSAGILSSKEHISMRISYALNLKGPSFSFYTACSTSLVAVHLASQALLSGECDMALAGGITLHLPMKQGCFYQEDLAYSPDGHTRSFDANARGLVNGSGIGIVLLKRLEDARQDRDHIYAIIKGTGINNDGNQKIGYTAPSIKGQEALLKDVYSAASVDTATITFVECHGSATSLGDPIEVEALGRVFHENNKKNGNHCAIGSVKSNIGHCDCAAGIAGFIKTVLALKHRQIPATLHFETANPKIDFENNPFYVNTQLKEWKTNGCPRRAGVNSLGLGGTNAHVILEEAAVDSGSVGRWVSEPAASEYQLLPLSARSTDALDKIRENLAIHLKNNPGINLADAAYTLQKGRGAFAWRRAFVCSGVEDAVNQFSVPETAPIQPCLASVTDRPLVFMYSGQGSQYIKIGLYVFA